MTDLVATDAPVSTTLDPSEAANPSGGGAPRVIPEDKPEAKETLSLRDTVAAELKADKEAPKPDAETDKADDAAKGAKEPEKGAEKPQEGKGTPEGKEPAKGAERGPDGKFAAKQAEGDEARPADAEVKDTQPKPNGHIEPPKNFLPDAKETWRNTPRAVQRDVADTIARHEAEVTKYRETAERYEPLRQYDELVRQNGRAGLHETLAEVKQLEDMMERNPVAALNQVLLRAGPRKADGQPVSLFELAQAIVNSGQDNYQRTVAQQPAAQEQREDPRIEQLQTQIAEMQQQQLATAVIEPFKRDHPRYEELKEDIAFFLASGKIPPSLSPSDRLAAAYDMAARINPASHANDAAAAETSPEPRARVVDDLSGSKSIKSAPGAVSAEMEPERGGSIRDLLASEMKRAKGSR